MDQNSGMVVFRTQMDVKWMFNFTVSSIRFLIYDEGKRFFLSISFIFIWHLNVGLLVASVPFMSFFQILFGTERSQMSSLVCNAYITLYTPFNAWHHRVHHIHIFCLCYAIESISSFFFFSKVCLALCTNSIGFFFVLLFLPIQSLCQAKASNRNE